MKRMIKSSITSGIISLEDIMSYIPSGDHITIQNSNGVLFDGICEDFLNLPDGEVVRDTESHVYSIGQLYECDLSLIRPYKNVLVIAIDTARI